MPPTAIYRTFLYGGTFYGYWGGLPTSADFDIFDFCFPNELVMGTLFAFPAVTSSRFGVPWTWFDVNTDYHMYSDDGFDSGFRITLPIPQPYRALQFDIIPHDLPQDFSDPTTARVFVGMFNHFGKMTGLLLSEDQGIGLSVTGFSAYEILPDSADIFDEGTDIWVFRITVNEDTNRCNLFITRKDVLAATGLHELRYTFSMQSCPAGEVDHIRVEVVGNVADTVHVALDCIRLDDREKVVNQRPIAVPGPDQTETLGQYASFDGRGSYDPEGQPIKFWWALTEAPDGASYRVQVIGDTPADSTGYTNVLLGSPGDFSLCKETDVLVYTSGYPTVEYSEIMYVAPDGSYIALLEDILPANVSGVRALIIAQSVWGGGWISGTVSDAIARLPVPPPPPHVEGDTFIVISPAGGPWAGHEGHLASWNSGAWAFTVPTFGEVWYVIYEFECYRYAGAGLWYEYKPKPWELDHWDGRTMPIGVILPDVLRLHTVTLVVNDGEVDSLPVEAILNVYETSVQYGLTPDLSFVWNFISDFWPIVTDHEQIETIWSGLAQIYTDLLMRLWQHGYSKSLFDIQRHFQARWLNYDMWYEEPNFQELPATIENSLSISGFSDVPSVMVTRVSDGVKVVAEKTYALDWVYTSITDQHYLVINQTPYKIARVEQGAVTYVITEDPLPVDDVINIILSLDVDPALPNVGDCYMVDTPAGGLWTGHDGEIATYAPGGWTFAAPEDGDRYMVLEGSSGDWADHAGEIAEWYDAGSEWLFTQSIRGRHWMIRPSVTSGFTNFSRKAVSNGDTAVFEIKDAVGDVLDINVYIYAAKGNVLVFDDTLIQSYLADATYTVLFKGVLRRSQLDIDDLVMTLPRLQKTIAVMRLPSLGSNQYLHEGRDFRVEIVQTNESEDLNTIQFYDTWNTTSAYGFHGETFPGLHFVFIDGTVDFEAIFGVGADLTGYVLELEEGVLFRLQGVLAPSVLLMEDGCLPGNLSDRRWWIRQMTAPPDTLWAEVTFLDNRPAIEANFGRLIDFSLDDLEARTDELDYLSAVQGLWYYRMFGKTPYNVRVGAQIILGLPFAEVAGTVTDIQSPFDATRSRILVQDADNEMVLRSYYYITSVGIETNPDTGVAYTVGDSVDRFAPLSQGVDVVDYLIDDDWWLPYVGSGDMYEIQKYHTFGIIVSSDVFEVSNLTFLIQYLRKYKPTYKDILYVVTKSLSEIIDIADPILFGPLVPPSPYIYPTDWPAYPWPSTWDDSPFEVIRGAMVYPSNLWTHRWWIPTEPPSPLVAEFGNLHLRDTPALVPDSWSGAWPSGAPGTHSPTRSDGVCIADDRDEKGHFIHRADTPLSAVNVLTDGDMEDGINPGPGRPWNLVLPGADPHTIQKVNAPVHAGHKSCEIHSDYAGYGIYQDYPTLVTAGWPVAVRGWLYIVDGSAEIYLIDQDGATTLVWARRNVPLNAWTPFTIFDWRAGTGASPLRVKIVTGPAGGEFYVDDVAAYTVNMPWDQVGGDRTFIGRTGSYTFGGSPDEYWEFGLFTEITGPGILPSADSIWVADSGSVEDDMVLTSGPAPAPPPIPFVDPWAGPYGPDITTWKESTHFGYGVPVDVCVDGDMEAVGIAAWAALNLCTVTKSVITPYSGLQCLRVATAGAAWAGAQQTPLPMIIGNHYLIDGWCRGDGTHAPQVFVSDAWHVVGTSANIWQYFALETVFTNAMGLGIFLGKLAIAAGYVEFDVVRIGEFRDAAYPTTTIRADVPLPVGWYTRFCRQDKFSRRKE
jgi:hypothetical protein